MTRMFCVVAFFCVVRLAVPVPVQGQSPSTEGVQYNRDVRPILSDKCFRCHGPDSASRQAGLRLDRRDDALAEHEGRRAIVPGKPDESELVRRIRARDDAHMPPADSNLLLAPDEERVLRQWIAEGAEYQPHWAFLPPRAVEPPDVRRAEWPRNAIDRFVLAELERRGLAPSPEADRGTLLRRVTLDLTGLPPTPAEYDAFSNDVAAGAYERVVDRLLSSPRFGERMAIPWLDAARYADTNGYYRDFARHAWPWRDWVIAAFNRNLPFDQFTIEQLAGDLLPNATVDQRIASCFNRNHMVTDESGSIDEEFRVGYVADRVDTTTTVWLGLTAGCARCHDHKYDPISQREYYQLFSYFNNVAEKGLVKEADRPPPVLSLPSAEQQRQLAALKQARQRLEAALGEQEPAFDAAIGRLSSAHADEVPEARAVVSYLDFEGDVRDRGPRQGATEVEGGALSFEPGVRGLSGVFDATRYVTVAGPSVDRRASFSLSAWIKPGSAPIGYVATKMDERGRGFELLWYKSQPRFNLVHEWRRNAIELTATRTFSGGEWHHVVVTYDGSSQAAGFRLYVDGVAESLSVKHDALTGSTDSDAPWQIAWKGGGLGFEGNLDEVRLYAASLSANDAAAAYRNDLLALPAAGRSRQQSDYLWSYVAEVDEQCRGARPLVLELNETRSRESALRQSIVAVPVMQELDKPRDTFMLTRGQYDQPTQRVVPGVPAALGSLPSGAPENRLGLARWLVAKENPLTARVAANRLWQTVYGEGLVRTANDFGLQGELPTHTELLDWLAVRYIDSGWDTKALVRLLVTSATYRQASHFTRALLERDPSNRWLARGPRYRLGAELLRDQALFVGGLLVERVGGPSVRPYQPAGLWEAVSYNGDQSYEQDHGAGLYRRSLYTFWKRQAPPPALLAFDGPTRETCVVGRARTNTPLQALVMLNDVTYVEAARGLATRMLRDGGREPDPRARHGFRLATGRWPEPGELAALLKLVEQEKARYAADTEAARRLLATGESPADTSFDPAELAAWSIVAATLLNLDETVTQH